MIILKFFHILELIKYHEMLYYPYPYYINRAHNSIYSIYSKRKDIILSLLMEGWRFMLAVVGYGGGGRGSQDLPSLLSPSGSST